MVAILLRTLCELRQANLHNNFWDSYLHFAGWRTETQTNNFSKGTEPVKSIGGFEAEQSGYRGHTLKPLSTQSYDAVKSTNSFQCWGNWGSEVGPQIPRTRKPEIGRAGKRIPFFDFLIHWFCPLRHWLILNLGWRQVLSFDSHFRLCLSVDFSDLPIFVVVQSVLGGSDPEPSFPVRTPAFFPWAAPCCHTYIAQHFPHVPHT